MERIEGIVRRNDNSWVKRRRIDTLVRAVGTGFLCSRDEEAIVEL